MTIDRVNDILDKWEFFQGQRAGRERVEEYRKTATQEPPDPGSKRHCSWCYDEFCVYDRCLADAASDPYVEVIRLYYFQGMKNAACARAMNCGERTCRRYRAALVQRFSTRLASDEFIREVLL